MRPLADLLIRLPAQAHPRLDVTHIPHREVGDAFLGTEVDHLPGGLVQQIALLPIEFRARLGFALEQPFGPARTHLAAAQLLLQHAVDLVAPVLAGAQLPSRDHEGVPFGRRHCRDVRLAQIHSRDGSRRQRRGNAAPVSSVRHSS